MAADGWAPDECEVLKTACPLGQGAFVPCSDRRVVPTAALVHRYADPYWDGNGKYSPVPQIGGMPINHVKPTG